MKTFQIYVLSFQIYITVLTIGHHAVHLFCCLCAFQEFAWFWHIVKEDWAEKKDQGKVENVFDNTNRNQRTLQSML